MRLMFLTLAAVVGFLATPALADHTGKPHGPLYTVSVKINGLVCDFCARALEKVFYKRDGVEGVDVNLDTKVIKLDIEEGTNLTDEEITQLVTDAGYNVTEIMR